MRDNEQQMKITKINEMLSKGELVKEDLKSFFESSADISFLPIEKQPDVTAFICEGMVDMTQLNDYFNKVAAYIVEGLEGDKKDLPPIILVENMEKIVDKVFSGFLIFYINQDSHVYAVDISKVPSRSPEESKTEISLKGPRDGFTEELPINISLIRKRVKSETLHNEQFEIGSLSKTKVSLLYLSNKINTEILEEIRNRLETLETESLLSSGQLEQWISDRTFSIFPHFDYITRADYAIECLLRGRFVVIVDGSPSVLIGPINLFAMLKSPEDVHFPYSIVALQRLIRFIGLAISIFAPGFYIAITTVNLDQLPFSLLATIVISREGLPFSLPLEAFFILLLFEILREAVIRMPSAVGQTISIVGGLIIGDAAIRAGLTSPTLLVVIAISAVATYTLVNQSLTGTVTILRIYSMIISLFLGVYGFVLAFLSIIIYLAQLESFRLSYLEPISSLRFRDYLNAFLTNPFKRKDFTSPTIQMRRRRE
ncbi:spore germination protein [Alkalihalobacterium chitinilyticum]|uniref:Spore germination protein n=1 Tax=Alkalihalobacterium chitinilyticum TaxID=2980103 RepID=A0ABT5VI02_9BACI|nr:spore germination protein [Alkalihalobacterium chitinilyticum]MDE5415084.1 spore germination protein [Alkalihalobacterium chitinilyticum]